MGTRLGCCRVSALSIDFEPHTKNNKQSHYPVSSFKQTTIDEEMYEMLRLDVVEPSKSPSSSTISLVR